MFSLLYSLHVPYIHTHTYTYDVRQTIPFSHSKRTDDCIFPTNVRHSIYQNYMRLDCFMCWYWIGTFVYVLQLIQPMYLYDICRVSVTALLFYFVLLNNDGAKLPFASLAFTQASQPITIITRTKCWEYKTNTHAYWQLWRGWNCVFFCFSNSLQNLPAEQNWGNFQFHFRKKNAYTQPHTHMHILHAQGKEAQSYNIYMVNIFILSKLLELSLNTFAIRWPNVTLSHV